MTLPVSMTALRVFALPSTLVLAVLASACSARLLDVGSTDAGPSPAPTSGSDSGGASSSAIKYVGGCSVGSCSSPQDYACAYGMVVSLECAPDPNAGVGSDPAGACLLTGECVDAGTPVCSTTPSSECGTDSSGNAICASAVGGGGYVSVEVYPWSASPPASVLTAYFNHGTESGNGQTLGACVFNPYGNETAQSGEVGVPAPNPGTVTARGPMLSASTAPACNGLYSPVTTPETVAAGDLVTFGWSPPGSDPDTFPASLPTIPAPHVIALAAGQAFAPSWPSIARGMDLPIAWTVTGTPMALEQVVVQLTQGITTMTCSFDASAGSGVIPADALLKLNAAQASYEVFSQHSSELKDEETSWDVTFTVNAVATTPAGLATGTATLE